MNAEQTFAPLPNLAIRANVDDGCPELRGLGEHGGQSAEHGRHAVLVDKRRIERDERIWKPTDHECHF